ncbi:hypothetical protein [Amnibacterium kyonggiense]|uniref:O-antigen ligase-related domain-containing protein n=1 Tax=Amnibacterium kyonggiense TaxID=595671 RepID=A0A4R7FDB0_9MICO|nr:hypothetical protein [Amnibacterium kyonggiense]TDS74939.1 hypothetical protein CLV52_3463 [Amnibacterium kyonggiense]
MSTSRRRLAATGGVWLLVLASVVSWRKGVLYTGGVDPVVVAKAVLAVAALGAAVLLRRTSPSIRPVAMWPALLVSGVVGLSLVGALAEGGFVADAVLAVRIALLAATILLLVSVTAASELLATLLSAMALAGLVAAVTGIPTLLTSRGRLGGGVPPLEPNEVATLLLPPAIGLLFVVVRVGLRPLPAIGLVVLSGTVVATGSRTALLMLPVALLVVLLVERRLSAGTSAVLLLGALAAYVVLAFSSILSSVALRGEGVGKLLTLNSRTISWNVVLSTPTDSWAYWVGRGLTVKSVPVVGQYWDTQVFDSSWISSLAQDGVVGTLLLAAYALGTLLATRRLGAVRALGAALATTILIRSFVENGLLESSTTFLVFFTLAALAWPGTATLLPRVKREPALPHALADADLVTAAH